MNVQTANSSRNQARPLLWINILIAIFVLIGFWRVCDDLNYSQPTGDTLQVYMNTAAAIPAHWAQVPPNWHSRWLACRLIPAWMHLRAETLLYLVPNTICTYYMLWLVPFVAMILYAERAAGAVLIGILAGMLLSHPGYQIAYYLPWDIPSMVLFTAAFLLAERRHWLAFAAVLILGALIKETIICAAFLFFLLGWRRGIVPFVLVPLVALILLRIATPASDSVSWLYSVHQFTANGYWSRLSNIWQELFANAGSLVALAVLVAREKNWPLLGAVGAYVLLNTLNNVAWGVYDEYRDWGDLLPLGWIIVARWIGSKATANAPGSARFLNLCPSVSICGLKDS